MLYISKNVLPLIHQTHTDMTTQSKSKAKEIIEIYGKIDVTIRHDDDVVEEKTYNSYEDCVSDVEFYENMGSEVYL